MPSITKQLPDGVIVLPPGEGRFYPCGPMQSAFREHHALQCGFCTPGFLVTLASADPAEWPDEQAVRELISGHLCRCTGYQQIVHAVLDAWGRTGEQPPSSAPVS